MRAALPGLAALVALALLTLPGCTTTEQVTVNLERQNVVFGIRHSGEPALADEVRALPSIRTDTGPIEGPDPVEIEIGSIGVETATVIPVGVGRNGSFDVPTHHEVGWYKYGASPGEFGSAVLAAHVTLNGADGAFRHLAELQSGDEVTVRYDDGKERRFSIVGLEQYEKSVLPLDDLFRRDGEPQLVLITCGGDYDPASNSYVDNIVAYAAPLRLTGS